MLLLPGALLSSTAERNWTRMMRCFGSHCTAPRARSQQISHIGRCRHAVLLGCAAQREGGWCRQSGLRIWIRMSAPPRVGGRCPDHITPSRNSLRYGRLTSFQPTTPGKPSQLPPIRAASRRASPPKNLNNRDSNNPSAGQALPCLYMQTTPAAVLVVRENALATPSPRVASRGLLPGLG